MIAKLIHKYGISPEELESTLEILSQYDKEGKGLLQTAKDLSLAANFYHRLFKYGESSITIRPSAKFPGKYYGSIVLGTRRVPVSMKDHKHFIGGKVVFFKADEIPINTKEKFELERMKFPAMPLRQIQEMSEYVTKLDRKYDYPSHEVRENT